MNRLPLEFENCLGEGDSPILLQRLRRIGTVPRGFRAAFCAWLFGVMPCACAWADGGAVIASQRVGSWQVSVLVSPVAPAVGPIDVSVLVQDAVSGQTVDGVIVKLQLAPEDSPADSIRLAATRAAATNKLFYAAQCDLPTAGRWTIAATANDREDEAELFAVINVAGPPPKWVELWPWLAWPSVVIALFLLREHLACMQRERRAQRQVVSPARAE
jgi:hypothetical protein